MRRPVVLTSTLSSIVVACCACALALDPSLDVNQYAHTAWKVRDGFAKGEINAIAQTPDGYLWLGTAFGLLRFDGVRAVPWQPPENQHLPRGAISSLLVSRDGTLWIGAEGLASWKDGKLNQYTELAEQFVFALLEDRVGTIWVGTASRPYGRICTIQRRDIHCHGSDGSLGIGVFALYEDDKGSLWAGVPNGLWRWNPNHPQFFSMPGETNGIQGIVQGSNGALLISRRGGIYQFNEGNTEPTSWLGTSLRFPVKKILRDRNGGLWIGTWHHGLVHVHQGRTDAFSAVDGLSGDDVRSLFEDREGNIWVSTGDGLDRFRDFPVSTFRVQQGLSKNLVGSVLADKNGSVWLGTYGGFNRWDRGRVAIPEIGGVKRDGMLNGLAPDSVFQDSRGRIWVSTVRELGFLRNGRFTPIKGIPGGEVLSIAEDATGDLWVINEDEGVFRISTQNKIRHIFWDELGHKDHASVLTADQKQGGVWIGFFEGGIEHFSDGQVRGSYTTADGLGAGRVGDFYFDSDGALWIATEGGLSRLKNDRLATLTTKNGLACDTVHWAIEDNDRSMWLYTACGLVRIARSDLEAWSRAADTQQDTNRRIHVTLFDSSDGVRSLADPGHYHPQVAKTPDGKMWFLPWDGVSVIDPHHLAINKLPPPVHIERITADGKTYEASQGQQLPPHVRDLAIDYTALSLVAPEKIHFRYKLEGQDLDWREVVNDRQVQYSNLAPRHYTFRVMASNNSGVWNEAGASLGFSVLPAFYQTIWFRALCGVGFLALLWGIYQLRIQELRRQFSIALDARVNERTRIARELHDTLLQNFHGLMFQFQAASNLMLRRPDEAKRSLDDAIDETKKALAESRDAIQGLRSEPIAKGNLAELLMLTSRELADANGSDPPPVFDLIEEGKRQPLSSNISSEVCRIALELVRNAYQHAHAQRIEAEIRYGDSMLRLRIRDDGKGIDPKVIREGGKVGHWGLRGVRERADRIGGRLDLWSEPGGGTEVQLLIPASIAYETLRVGYRARLVRKVKNRA